MYSRITVSSRPTVETKNPRAQKLAALRLHDADDHLRTVDVARRQIVARQRDAEQEPHPGHDPIAVADARTALDEVQLERRTSSGVAVSGERLSQAANRLQLEMWLRCVCGLSLRAAMSSIMR